MTKLRPEPITAADLEAYLKSEADFAFEMRVLSTFERLGFQCEHGGTYSDPVTGIVRQFDIRASFERSPPGFERVRLRITLAVECKNIRPNSPLLIHAVPRTKPEAFHELLLRAANEPPRVLRLTDAQSFYRPGQPVAKETDQVGRRTDKDGSFVTSDQPVFARISQAVNGTYDLVRRATRNSGRRAAHSIIPVVVLPDERLWQVDYKMTGEVSQGPHLVPRASLFLGKNWSVDLALGLHVSYTLSHLELVTLSSIEELAQDLRREHQGVFAPEEMIFDMR